MKKKDKIIFVCQSCGHKEKKWHGRCMACDEWNTFSEETEFKTTISRNGHENKAESITKIDKKTYQRTTFAIEELDRVLGGGLVKGSVSLIGGEPGAGKSTLLQMASAALAKKGLKVLYISGEESKSQIRLNAERLNAIDENLLLLCETSIDAGILEAQKVKPDFLVIDSVQTVQSFEVESQMGSVLQIKEVCARVLNFAKQNGIPTFLVGHVTKDGAIAGPRLLEHMVDTVLYFEQSRVDHCRLLRSHKNRYGSTNEIGLFEMGNKGLKGINNPSLFFLAERPQDAPGSAIFCTLEGTRPLLVEIQALAVETSFGTPRRTAVGIDGNRCSIIAATLEKHLGLMLSRMDLFISVAGGVDIKETALDLPLALAIVSSIKNVSLPNDLIAIGEIGLSGEIRSINRISDRLKEASRLGFNKALVPKSSTKNLSDCFNMRIKDPKNIREAVNILL